MSKATPTALRDLAPVFGSDVLSFVFIGIYWNNHHHLLQAVRYVSGASLWANLHLLFWLSLVPFTAGRERFRCSCTPSPCPWRSSTAGWLVPDPRIERVLRTKT